MSKLSQFKNWYAKYLIACDDDYEKSLKNDYVSTDELTTRLDTLMNARVIHSEMSYQNSLDDKIQTVKDSLKRVFKKIDNVGKIKKEMKENLKMNSSKTVYKRILAHPFVDEIIVDKDSLSIITKKLYANKIYIGYYQIMITSDGSHCDASTTRIKNLEYQVHDQHDHWHVNNEKPCLASWKPILQRHLDTYQLFLFFDTFIHYLTLSDSTHANIHFDKWIEDFKDKGAKRKLMKSKEANMTYQYTNTISSGTIGVAWGSSWT